MCTAIIILLWFVVCSEKLKPYMLRLESLRAFCDLPRMTVSMLQGFSHSNCSHNTHSLTYCKQTYLLDVACFEPAPKWALSMSSAILLRYFYKASEGLCKTYVMNRLLYFSNHTLFGNSISIKRRICITSAATIFRRCNWMYASNKSNIF